jgi:hypothetical protein
MDSLDLNSQADYFFPHIGDYQSYLQGGVFPAGTSTAMESGLPPIRGSRLLDVH